MSDMTYRNPPTRDRDSAPFWDGLDGHRIVIQHCGNCGKDRCPPMSACPWCGSTEYTWSDSAGVGVVYSWITAHRPVGNLVEEDLPVTFATVEFEPDCRLVTRYLGPSPISIGAPVVADFISHDGWTELVVRTSGGTS